MIKEVRHVWSESDDRWIYLEFNEKHEIVGINYCQGNDYKYFKKEYSRKDEGLTEFYEVMIVDYDKEVKGTTTLEFINKVCWTYHSAIAFASEYS